MPASPASASYICARCIRASRHIAAFPSHTSLRHIAPVRNFADSAPQHRDEDNNVQEKDDKGEGAMSRRLRDMSEEALETGGRSARKAVEEAGFSEDLRKQLEERIAAANFKSEHRNAFIEAELPSHAGRGTRDIATAEPWAGTESIHDASLRMLTDAHKPLKGTGGRISGPSVPLPRAVDTGRGSAKATGTRLANARDRSGLYSSLKDSDLDKSEREKRFQELKDRFSPHARSVVPGTIQGLASLANERIESAIARGQFKNLPNRGKQLERDYNASNPFLDTTEYFMNKMIQRQDIVPPWIEKQQELVSTVTKFRARLRNDWKRHAARVIASKGGTLAEQVKKAEAYAKAELLANPARRKTETLNSVDDTGHVSQISLSGALKPPSTSAPDAPVTEEVVVEKTTLSDTPSILEDSSLSSIQIPLSNPPTPSTPPAPYPFRDPVWESMESSYQTLAIASLNSLTRSYNLQAPELARKPYFSLSRELASCYADVAPQLADAIRERAVAPQRKTEGFGAALAGGGGVLTGLVGGEKVRVRDERAERRYGFRQLWKDVWGGA